MRADVHPLPKRIVIGVRHHIIPKLYGIAEITRLEIWQCTHVQVKFVIVGYGKFNAILKFSRSERFWARYTKICIKVKSISQEKNAVMMEIVADKPLGNRSLRRN